MRLFIAIPLPATLRARLTQLQEGLPAARWVPEENLHLTLRFIGEVDGRVARDIDAALSQIHAEPFSVSLVGVDRFGGGKPRMLWAGVETNPALVHLQAKIEQALQRAGLAPEGRKFKPHVTLARFNANPGERLYDYLSRHGLFRAAPFPVDQFVLYSSHLGHSGAIYTPEAVYSFARPGELRAPSEFEM